MSLGHQSFYRRFFKRFSDVVLLIITAPVTLPLIGLLGLFIWLKTGTHPFYTQSRIGKNGQTFKLWKLRTMVPGAESLLNEYLAGNPVAKSEWDETQKLKNDPRITHIGQILRKTSLDELPQLWNVFVGDMSLVGPRPMMPEQQVLYTGLDYYKLRPGITGFWQISDRNEGSFAARAQFDADYNAQLSAGTDVAVLLATFAVVLRGTGY
jgi:lipopolysaccharide/colanic/teichoic acid biosynthesis glycosyltransferase